MKKKSMVGLLLIHLEVFFIFISCLDLIGGHVHVGLKFDMNTRIQIFESHNTLKYV